MTNLKKCIPLLGVLILACSAASAQDVSKFAGTWKGVHAGKTYAVVTIDRGKPLKISVVSAVVHADEQGEITKVDGDVVHQEVLLDSRIAKGRLLFKTRQDDGDVVNYEMKLDGKDAAVLTITGLPATVKPFRLERSS